jgi:4,4'-diaponeurosporenoate glycosyltransferase
MIAIFLILWACGFIVAVRFFGLGAGVPPVGPLRVSIIIPARDEEHNLPRLLESLAEQSVRPYEILVVDDSSADGTAGIARKLGATVIESAPLPDGWRGKTWACHQGALAAGGGLFLFMDADTWFEPEGLARLLEHYRGGAFSVLPYHAVRKPYEDLSLFFNFSMAAGTVPDGLSGQCFLVGRADYQKVGGHESVCGRVLENFRLAEEFREAGISVRSVIGRKIVSFRMYPQGFTSLVEGWTKGFASGAVRTPPRILLLVVAWMTGLMLPLLGEMMTGEWPLWLAAYFLGVLQVGLISRKIGSFHWTGIIFYPVPLVFFFSVFGWSALRSGKKVSWKGREIHAD